MFPPPGHHPRRPDHVGADRRSEIRQDGQITGNFTKKKVDELVNILRGRPAGHAQAAAGQRKHHGRHARRGHHQQGRFALGLAFAAMLVFMIVYYRFAGLVASVALLANLLLTVAFMVVVQATFTLPGLAGLVLMLGMAVDANVLIYERLREERERGASLALAIRNGYDRAFPTIIDTHLSSIFTAIVLYVVGNDQLKGFGISLTVGLIISLFTSLYMTRLMFDFWLSRSWLHKLSMFRLLSKPNIDFMAHPLLLVHGDDRPDRHRHLGVRSSPAQGPEHRLRRRHGLRRPAHRALEYHRAAQPA